MNPGPDLVIGVGHRHRRDDGAGPAVADRLAAQGIRTVEHSGEGLGLIGLWEGAARIVLIDAMVSGRPPGTVLRLDAHAEAIPTGAFRCSSHLVGVAEAVELARALGRLPDALVIYGIEGTAFGFGEGLSPEVAAAVDSVTGQILEALTEKPLAQGAG